MAKWLILYRFININVDETLKSHAALTCGFSLGQTDGGRRVSQDKVLVNVTLPNKNFPFAIISKVSINALHLFLLVQNVGKLHFIPSKIFE